MCVRTHARGVWGYAPPGKLDALRLLLRPLMAQSGTTVVSYLYFFTCMNDLYRRPHAVAEESKLLISSVEYYIGLLSLELGHNVARLDTRRTCCETRD